MGFARTLPVLHNESRESLDHPRPRVRSECIDGPRPCPFVSCRHHLYLEVRKDQIRTHFTYAPEDMTESCSLDVADRGGVTADDVGELMGFTRARGQQILAEA